MSAKRVDGVDLGALLRLIFPDLTDQALAELTLTAGGSGTADLSCLRRVLSGMNLLARPTRVSIRFDQNDVTVVRVHGMTLAVDRADAAVAKQILADRFYEPHLSPAFARLCRPGMRVVDVGANVGYYTFLASRLVGPGGSVLALEPNSENCRLLLLSKTLNRADNVELLPVALDAQRGWSYFSPEIGSNGSFRRGGPALADGTGTIVPTFPLDALAEKPIDLIKLDVEGAEGRVVDGARRTLETSRPIVVSEFCPRMLAEVSGWSARSYLSWFADRNYRLYLANRRTYRLDAVENPAALLAGWDDPERIEDVLLVPAEAPAPA